MPNNYKYDTWEDAIDDAFGSAMQNNKVPSAIGWHEDRIDEDDFGKIVAEAIKNIKDIPGLTITFKGEK